MSVCPFCRRPLLSQASPCCNWCGREIPDADYQAQAERRREAFFQEQAIHDAVSLARMEALLTDPFLMPADPLVALPMLRLPRPPQPQAPQSQPPEPEPPTEETRQDTTEARFRHLEL